MSRQLLLLRHGKSAWPRGVADFDRPLAPRGEHDTGLVGAFLAHRRLLPDHVVASPARRAQETARGVLTAARCSCPVITERELYAGDAMQVLRELPPDARRVLLVGHEPELLDLLHGLSGADVRFPTAALAVVDLEAPWALQPAGRAVLQVLITPKLLAGAN